MKIYISGKVTGLPYDYVKDKFNSVEELLTEIGFEVVNPLNNGLDKDDMWEKHICKCIEMLLPCDAIYMMNNWVDSIGASIEYDIANRTSKYIWFESNVLRNNTILTRIHNAIHEVMGLKIEDYIVKSRKRDGFFARMILAYHCRREKMRLADIAAYVKRNNSTVLHLLKKYQDDFTYNSDFRNLATRVNDILNKK